jgi:hypothetical protein
VYLKVLPIRGLCHFKVQGKLTPTFIGPFKITEKWGEVAYQRELPPQLSDVHNVFHVAQLKNGCVCPKRKYTWKIWVLVKISLTKSTLPRFWRCLRESPKIRSSRSARCNWVTIPRTKLLEREEELKAKFPSFFSDPSESRGRDSF